jgi:hypothetical protein
VVLSASQHKGLDAFPSCPMRPAQRITRRRFRKLSTQQFGVGLQFLVRGGADLSVKLLQSRP